MVNGKCWISSDTSHTDHASSSMQDPRTQNTRPRQMSNQWCDHGNGLLITEVGVLGNSSVLYNNLFLYFTQSRLSSIDWVLMHLIVANILTLLCKWVPQTIAGFGWKDFLNNFVCKRLFYFHRVGTSVSISNTSLPRYLTRPSLSALMTQSG